MGRKRAARPIAPQAAARPERGGNPVGGARVAWSQLAGLAAVVVTGVGFALTDVLQVAWCNSDDTTCTLGTYLIGAMVSALVGVALVARLFRLGWEWALVAATVIVAMPLLLDLGGGWAWLGAAATPTLAALLTLGGPHGPRWRAPVIAAGCVLVIALVLVWTFVLPTG